MFHFDDWSFENLPCNVSFYNIFLLHMVQHFAKYMSVAIVPHIYYNISTLILSYYLNVCFLAANERQVEEARLYIERNVMSHIYTHAMYPNGDGDIMRDQ